MDILLALKGELEFSPDGGVSWVPPEEREAAAEASAAKEGKDEEMAKPDDGIDWLDDEEDEAPEGVLENGMEWEDDDDDGDGWLNPDNIDETLEESGLQATSTDLIDNEQEMVGCVTTDFAMQNVMLQIGDPGTCRTRTRMRARTSAIPNSSLITVSRTPLSSSACLSGLNVVSVDGMMVKRVTTYVLKCEACFKTTDDMEAQFCPSCGNHTLYKVATTVAADGSVHHNSLKRRQNLRGTKFSIPLPKGGRRGVNEDLLLREDQLPKRRKARDKDLMDEDTSGWTFSYKNKGQGAKNKVGHGRKNPNEKKGQVRGKKTGR